MQRSGDAFQVPSCFYDIWRRENTVDGDENSEYLRATFEIVFWISGPQSGVPDQQQHLLGICLKCRFSGCTPDSLHQTFQGWNPVVCVCWGFWCEFAYETQRPAVRSLSNSYQSAYRLLLMTLSPLLTWAPFVTLLSCNCCNGGTILDAPPSVHHRQMTSHVCACVCSKPPRGICTNLLPAIPGWDSPPYLPPPLFLNFL